MPDTNLTRGEFDQYCKSVNGELLDIKRMAELAAQKSDHTCELLDARFEAINTQLLAIQKGAWSRVQVMYVTTVTAMFVGTFSVLITFLATHIIK